MSDSKRVFLFGEPIAHSLAPLLHNTIYAHLGLPWTYTLYESRCIPSFLSDCIGAPDFQGSAVTMPHKVAMIPHLDALDQAGHACGAINTIYKTAHGLIGTNTDCIGIKKALLSVPRPRGRDALIIGAGGTTRAAVYALREMGCETIYLLNRDPEEVAGVVQHFKQFTGYTVIALDPLADTVPCVSYVVGAIPDAAAETDAEVAVRHKVVAVLQQQQQQKGVLLEMCYKPRHTTLLKLAQAEGWTTVEGIEAMIHQGIAQVSLWSGIDADQVVFPGLSEVIRQADEISQSG